MWISMFLAGTLLAASPAEKLYQGWGYEVRVPEKAVTTNQAPVDDVDITSVTLDGKIILTLYAGSQPAFPHHVPKNLAVNKHKIGALEGQTFAWGDAKKSRETLVSLPQSKQYPPFLHVFYTDLSPGEAKSADAMIESIKPSSKKH